MADYEEYKKDSKPLTLFNDETGQSFQIPVLKGNDGPDVLDIRDLYKETGMFTYDPGFTSTASCKSSIT
ncbi:MAG: Citrate synthase, partial [Alphaproteobacteria bacterium MarineAlpha5_Bin6]